MWGSFAAESAPSQRARSGETLRLKCRAGNTVYSVALHKPNCPRPLVLDEPYFVLVCDPRQRGSGGSSRLPASGPCITNRIFASPNLEVPEQADRRPMHRLYIWPAQHSPSFTCARNAMRQSGGKDSGQRLQTSLRRDKEPCQ